MLARPRIAVTFNPSINGPVLSLRKSIATSEAILVDCDYREIVPQSDTIDQIYEDHEKLLDTLQKAKKKAKAFLSEVDCLILSGNPAKVDPRLFGQALNGEDIDLERSIAELALIHVALQMGLPLLAICGGLQILNVYLGGSIKDLNITDLLKQGFDNYEKIRVDSNSEFEKIINPKPINNNDSTTVEETFTSHFQVLAKLGGKNSILNKDYLKISARADDTCGNIEAVEGNYGSLLIGTQFHPEVAIYGYDQPQLPANMSGTIYKSTNEDTVLKNKRIIEAFILSAQTFHNKKLLHRTIKNNQADKELLADTKPPAYRKTIENKHMSNDFSEKDSSKTLLQTTITAEEKLITHNHSQQLIQNRIQFLKNRKKPVHNAKVGKISLHNIFNQLTTAVVHTQEMKHRNPIASIPKKCS